MSIEEHIDEAKGLISQAVTTLIGANASTDSKDKFKSQKSAYKALGDARISIYRAQELIEQDMLR